MTMTSNGDGGHVVVNHVVRKKNVGDCGMVKKRRHQRVQVGSPRGIA